MKASIQYVDIPKGSRVLAASDLHAHGTWLKALLDEVGFCDDDYLFLVGDYLERGKDNLATLRYVMELCKKPNVYAAIGNVDIWSLNAVFCEPEKTKERIAYFAPHHGGCFYTDMCIEAGLPYDTLEEIAYASERIKELYRPEIDFLLSLPTVIDTPFYTFVHGGIPTKHLEELDLSDAYRYLKNDNFIAQDVAFDKWTIVGHWPATLYSTDSINLNPHIAFDQKIIDIDGGCGVKDDGQVNLLVLPSAGDDVFAWRCYDAFPQYRALDPQRQSAESRNINFSDPWIEILQRSDDLVYIRRISDGYALWVPANRVHETDGKWRIWGDSSDFRPAIQPGDVVSLIRTDAVGTYIKKDGVCGYYDGRLEQE